MEAITIINKLASSCTPAKASDAVLNSECAFTFHSPYTSDKGIVVNCSNYVGTVEGLAMKDVVVSDGNNSSSSEALFVRIVKKRVEKSAAVDIDDDAMDTTVAVTSTVTTTSEEKAVVSAPTKLGIGVEGGFATEDDKYETIATYSVVVLKAGSPPTTVNVVCELPYNDETKSTFSESVVTLVDSIILHAGITTQQDVKAWALDTDETVIISKYAHDLPFVDNAVMIDPNPTSWKCEKSGATENLWLNLSDGFIGGGRKNWDGSGGSNGALDHYEETGCKYPLTVKLGTITSDLNSADCYSYAKDEDCPVRVPNLAELLEKRGIKVANMQKTVKSTAELEVELNYNYDFNAITSAGETLEPATGPGFQGLQNLGNSCYMNSILQMLFSVPELSTRYGTTDAPVEKHPLLTSVDVKNAPTDLLCQTTKVACALTSGAFAKPIAEEKEDSDSTTDPKYRLAPRMFKHVIGKDHVEFRTGQQQDAAQFLQYMLEQVERAELKASTSVPYLKDKAETFHPTSHLFSFNTTDRLVCSGDNSIKYKESSGSETVWSLPIPMDKAVVREEAGAPDTKRAKTDEESKEEQKPVPTVEFSSLLEQWAAESAIEGIRWPHLDNAVHKAQQTTRLSNFPRYLILQLQRYQLGPDWQPVKLEVKVDIPQKIDLTHLRSSGPQDGEKLVPAEPEGEAAKPSAPEINEGALCQLMDMGFSMNGCKRALTAVGGSDVEAAMNWVFEHSMDPDFNDPMPEPGQSAASGDNGSGVDEGVVMSLVDSLGCFTPDQVRAALKETNGAADRAADWLFSHMDDLDGAIAAINSRASESATPAAPKLPLEDGNGKYTMVGTVSHIGKHTGSGHYVAHLRRGDKWVIFNDEK
ncbi:MAG: hypothetical protein SGILL_008598, partial [Bacillariaceae sp.]